MAPRPVTKTCAHCGVRLKLSRQTYCSVACANRARAIPERDRFWPLVAIDSDGCWLWTSAVDHSGYGVFTADGHRAEGAHRTAYRLTHGTVPSRMAVCHRCDERRCCRPDHLFLGTAAENNADMVSKRRHAFGERDGLAKLSVPDVREIRRQYASGASQTELAARFGVTPGNVDHVVRRRTWAHVT